MPAYAKSALSFLLLSLPLLANGQGASPVSRIEIHSTWSGMTRGTRANLVIVRDGDGYSLDDSQTSRTAIDPSRVEALVKALYPPAIHTPSLQALGLTPDWLKAHAIELAERASRGSVINGDTAHPADVAAILSDPSAMEEIVAARFHQIHTDDYPSVNINISFADGSTCSVVSQAQYPLMLPWGIRCGDSGKVSYDGEISHAIAALMPPKSANQERLCGESLPGLLAFDAVVIAVHQAQTRTLDQLTSGALAAVRTQYTASALAINRYPGSARRNLDPDKKYLHMDLTSPSLPENFDIQASLCLTDGKIKDIQSFLRNADHFEQLVLAVPWLKAYIHQHPELRVHLSLLDAASLDEDSFQRFSRDMQVIGRSEWIPRVEAAKDQIALVSTGSRIAPDSVWLIFPDGQTLLWQFMKVGQDATVLQWAMSDLPIRSCGGTLMTPMRCAGEEISPTGALEPEP